MALSAERTAADSVYTGGTGLEKLYTERRKYDKSDKVVSLDRVLAPLDYRLRMAMKKITVGDPEPKVFTRQEKPLAISLTANSGKTYNTEDTLYMANADAKWLQPGDILTCPNMFCDSDGSNYSTTKFASGYMPETLIVRSTQLSGGSSSGDAAVVVHRGNGYDPAGANQLTSSHQVILNSNALPDGGNAPNPVDHEPSIVQNFLQFFSRTVGEDNIYRNTDVYGKETMAERFTRVRKALNREIEMQLFFGRKAKQFVGGKVRRLTGGIVEDIPDSSGALDGVSRLIDFNSTFDFDLWRKYMEIIFRYGNTAQRKWMFTGPKFFTELYGALQDFMVLNDKVTNTLDIKVNEIDVGHGTLEIMKHPSFRQISNSTTDYSLDCVIVDPEFVDLMVMSGNDVQTRSNIQENRSHGYENEVFGTIGIRRTHPTAHAYIYNLKESV